MFNIRDEFANSNMYGYSRVEREAAGFKSFGLFGHLEKSILVIVLRLSTYGQYAVFLNDLERGKELEQLSRINEDKNLVKQIYFMRSLEWDYNSQRIPPIEYFKYNPITLEFLYRIWQRSKNLYVGNIYGDECVFVKDIPEWEFISIENRKVTRKPKFSLTL